MSALETLLSEHRSTLSNLYTKLSPAPLPLLTSKLDLLHQALASTISQQRLEAEQEIEAVETSLDDKRKKAKHWRNALGEQDNKDQEEQSANGIPLLTQLTSVEKILNGMRERMETRGRMILKLQATLLSFTHILGMTWLSIEIPAEPLTEWDGQDLRLERLSALEREIVRCESEMFNRREIINANVTEIFAIRAELGIHQNSASTPPASNSNGFESANTPVSDPFDELILCHLGVGEDREKKEMIPTEENLLRVEAKRKWLEEEKDHRNALIQGTYDKLHPLWSMLGVSDLEMESFVERWMGSTSDVVNAYQVELKRMLTLKRSNLSAFIIRERISLTALWDSLYLSPAQRLACFPPFAISVQPSVAWNAAKGVDEDIVNDNVSEELLVAHEMEREKWEGEVRNAVPVLERLEKYFGVVEEMRELEASASDPSRLLGKSTRGDPGRLLREEKARKRVVKDKPKLEGELRRFIPTWEAEHGRAFLVNGKRFLDDLDEKLEAELAEKESKKRSKTIPASSTSTSSSNRTVPLRSQHTGSSSTAALLRAQHTGGSTVPIKRQNTGAPSKAAIPASKRPAHQVAQPTGSRATSTMHSTNSVLGDSTNSNSGSTSASAGMKIPAGWGGSTTSASTTAYPAGEIQSTLLPQYTGFRPNTRLSGGRE